MSSQQASIRVFVYGTLKPGKSNYPIYCQGKTIAEIPAYTRGQLYHLLPGYPAMTRGNNRVEGYLLIFSRSDILQSLDILEDYCETKAANLNLYSRQQLPIYSLSDEPLGIAWCYLMTLEKITQFQGQLLNDYSWNR